MNISKTSVAAALRRFPFVLILIHNLWRLTRPRFTTGVVGVVVSPSGEVLVVEHVFHTEPQWGLPGGYVDRNEDPGTAVARELREELELTVEVVRPLLVECPYPAHLDIAYLCQTSDAVGKLSSELTDYRWAAPDQLPAIRPFHRKAISEALVLLEANE